MRILHIGKFFPPYYGGIETFMSQLMKVQSEYGHSVSAIVHCEKMQSGTGNYQWNSCDIYEVQSFGSIAFTPIAPSFPFKLFRAFKRVQPDLIHIHMPNVSAFWLLVLKLFVRPRSKIVIHWHSDVLGEQSSGLMRILYQFYRMFERLLLRTSDHIIATSDNYLHSSKPLKPFFDKASVVPLGISLKDEGAISQQDSSESQDVAVFEIIVLGRLTYYKGHVHLIDALRILKKRSIQFSVKIVGEGELKQSLIEKVNSLELSSNVKFLGHVSESHKKALFSQANLLVLPSIERTEAFGVVLLEAAMHKIPAIVTDVPGSGMSFVVEHGNTGYVCKRCDPGDIANRLSFLAENPSRVEAFGLNAHERLIQNFDIEVVAKKIESVYETCNGVPID